MWREKDVLRGPIKELSNLEFSFPEYKSFLQSYVKV